MQGAVASGATVDRKPITAGAERRKCLPTQHRDSAHGGLFTRMGTLEEEAAMSAVGCVGQGWSGLGGSGW